MKAFSCLWQYLAEFFFTMRDISGKICRENQNTHSMFYNVFQIIVPFMR